MNFIKIQESLDKLTIEEWEALGKPLDDMNKIEFSPDGYEFNLYVVRDKKIKVFKYKTKYPFEPLNEATFISEEEFTPE